MEDNLGLDLLYCVRWKNRYQEKLAAIQHYVLQNHMGHLISGRAGMARHSLHDLRTITVVVML